MGRKQKQPPLTVVSAVYPSAPDLLKRAAAYKTLADVAIRMLRAETDEKISPEEAPGAPKNSNADARESFVHRVPIDIV